MNAVLGFLFSGVGTLIFFAAAFGGSLIARKAAQAGDLRKAKIAGWAAFIGSSLLALITIISAVVGRSPISLLFAGLWVWFAWRDYKFLNSLPS